MVFFYLCFFFFPFRCNLYSCSQSNQYQEITTELCTAYWKSLSAEQRRNLASVHEISLKKLVKASPELKPPEDRPLVISTQRTYVIVVRCLCPCPCIFCFSSVLYLSPPTSSISSIGLLLSSSCCFSHILHSSRFS